MDWKWHRDTPGVKPSWRSVTISHMPHGFTLVVIILLALAVTIAVTSKEQHDQAGANAPKHAPANVPHREKSEPDTANSNNISEEK